MDTTKERAGGEEAFVVKFPLNNTEPIICIFASDTMCQWVKALSIHTVYVGFIKPPLALVASHLNISIHSYFVLESLPVTPRQAGECGLLPNGLRRLSFVVWIRIAG